MTPLMWAARSGLRQAPHVAQLLLSLPPPGPARVDLQNRQSQTSVMLAADAGMVDVLRALLTAEPAADINARDACGRTALHYAAARGRLECVRVLLTADPPADVEFEAALPAMLGSTDDVRPRKAEAVAATDEIRVLLVAARREQLLLSLRRVVALKDERRALQERVRQLEAAAAAVEKPSA